LVTPWLRITPPDSLAEPGTLPVLLAPYPIFPCDTHCTVPSVRLVPFLEEKLNLELKCKTLGPRNEVKSLVGGMLNMLTFKEVLKISWRIQYGEEKSTKKGIGANR
jgi:hypothetical protein